MRLMDQIQIIIIIKKIQSCKNTSQQSYSTGDSFDSIGSTDQFVSISKTLVNSTLILNDCYFFNCDI